LKADYTSYRAKFRKDGVVLQNPAQAKLAFIKLVHTRGYISEEREGKLIISRMEDFGTMHWPATEVEISEEADHIIFDFKLSQMRALLQGFPKKLQFYIDIHVMPEWSLLRVE
jgi:hypothetical protein